MEGLADRLKAIIADTTLIPDDEWVDAMYRESPCFFASCDVAA